METQNILQNVSTENKNVLPARKKKKKKRNYSNHKSSHVSQQNEPTVF